MAEGIARRVLIGAGIAGLAGCSADPAEVPPAPRSFMEVAVYEADRLPGEDLFRLASAHLTVTIGFGPRLSNQVSELPAFARERMEPEHRGGDVMVQITASDAASVSRAAARARDLLGNRLLWRQTASSGPSTSAVGRNVLGFHDPIVNPKTEAEFKAEVWRPDGSTVAVVRRLRVDVARFLALPLARQEQIVGRRRADGAPLSGGGPLAAADLHAKTAEGRWLIPPDAHVRRAHALATGSGMMLRRGATFDNGPLDRGLLFVSFQRDQRTFNATQARLDEGDALLDFTTCTASGVFWIPPGLRL